MSDPLTNKKTIDISALDEDRFSALIEENMPDDIELGPADTAAPYAKAIRQIAAGTALVSITINAAALNIWLPLIGTFLMLLGFRALRDAAPEFRLCFAASCAAAAWHIVCAVINATIYNTVFDTPGFKAARLIASLLWLMIYAALWKGLRRLESQAGVDGSSAGSGGEQGRSWLHPAGALFAMQLLLTVMAYANAGSGPVVWLLLAAYIIVLVSLFKLAKRFEAAAYIVSAAPPRSPDRLVFAALIVITAAGVLGGMAFAGKYPMELAPYDAALEEPADAEAIRRALVEGGCPEYLAADLDAKELKACRGFDALELKAESNGDAELTHLAVRHREPGKDTWHVIHYFRCKEGTRFYGTESLLLTPAYGNWKWATVECVEVASGRLLCESGGKPCTAEYYYIDDSGEYAAKGQSFIPWDDSARVYAAFSVPRGARSVRGWLSYTIAIKPGVNSVTLTSELRYYHQRTPLLFPFRDARREPREFNAHWYRLQHGLFYLYIRL